jgi:hypothetical protein
MRSSRVIRAGEVPLHLRDGGPEVGIGIARLDVAFAQPPVIDTPGKPDDVTSSPSAETAGSEMINDCPLLVAGGGDEPPSSRSSSMVSRPTLCSSTAICCAVSTDFSSRCRSSVEVRIVNEEWRHGYKTERSHKSLGNVPPLTFLPRPTNVTPPNFKLSA